MDRTELADFLRRCRARLQPTDVGLPPGSRRRTAGLRREEVAQLAGMSVDYYVRLEQARSPQPSEQILSSLARALRLTDDERDHLFHLAGRDQPRRRRVSTHVRPGLLHILDELTRTPAVVVSDIGDLLAGNAMARALLGEHDRGPGRRDNHIWRWFTEPEQRDRYPSEDHDTQSRVMVADLRATAARRAGDADVEELVTALLATSSEFAELWSHHDVAVRRSHRKRVVHPVVGLLELDVEDVATDDLGQRLLILTAAPGSESAERLELLRVIGSQDLDPEVAPDATRDRPAAGRAPSST